MDAFWVLAPVAGLMALIVAALVRWSAGTRTVVAAAVALFLLGMMAAMFVGTLIYFAAPGRSSLVIGLWVAAALMAVSVFPVFALILREARAHLDRGATYVPGKLNSAGLAALAGGVTALVLASELLMGASFDLASGTAGSVRPLWAFVATTVASPWFLFPMAIEMGLSLAWLRRRFPLPVAAALAAQAVMMGFAPPALPGYLWSAGSALVASAAMGLLLVYLVRAAYRGDPFDRPVRGYLVRCFAATAVMGVGLALWAAGLGVAVFALGMVAQMAVFFGAIVIPETFGPDALTRARAECAPTA